MNIHEAFLVLSGRLPVDDPAIKARLDRAYDIVRMPGYTLVQGPAEGTWLVEKASTSALETDPTVYVIDDSGCSCPDAMTARAGLCKHVLATRLLTIMEGE